MVHDCSAATNTANVYPFDARGIAKRFRHAAIFGALNEFENGETMRFYNDHNPLPLLAQIEQYFGPHIKVSSRSAMWRASRAKSSSISASRPDRCAAADGASIGQRD